MPTYEYQCSGCGREFEVRQRISEPALTRCEQCGGSVKRLLSAAPFILKGGGWYVTDYPSESRKKALASEKSSGSADGAAKQDTAPADKPAADKPAADQAGSRQALDEHPGIYELVRLFDPVVEVFVDRLTRTLAPRPARRRAAALPSRTATSSRPWDPTSAPTAPSSRSPYVRTRGMRRPAIRTVTLPPRPESRSIAVASIEVMRLPNRSTPSTSPSTPPVTSRAVAGRSRTGSPIGGPKRAGGTPSVRCAAAGPKTSRPWKVAVTVGRR